MNSAPGVLTLSGASLHEREGQWNHAVNDRLLPMSIRLTPIANDRDRWIGKLRYGAVGDLVMSQWICPPSEGVRRREHFRLGDPEVMILFFADSGIERITHGASQTLLSKETGLLFSSSVAIDFSTSGNLNKYSLAVPRVAMEEIKPRLAIGDGVRLDQSRPGVRMLRSLLNVVWSDLGRMTPVELDFARTALLTLLAAAAGPEEPVDQAAIMPLLRKQMDSWIDAHLSFGPLTVGDLATAHHVSERTVQRVYARNGDTVSGVIRRRRIQRARAELISTDHLIASVAAHAGYFDPSHFARDFRHYYGTTPRQYRARHRATTTATSGAQAALV